MARMLMIHVVLLSLSAVCTGVALVAPLGGHSLHVRIAPKARAGRDPVKIPKDLLWALSVDGRDAHRGPHAYDSHGFSQALSALPIVLDSAKEALSWNLLSDVIKPAVSSVPIANGHRHECMHEDCFRDLSCERKTQVLADLDRSLTKIEHNGDCIEHVKPYFCTMPKATVLPKFIQVVEEYGRASAGLMKQQATDAAKLDLLARFLRSFAWLHPYVDTNGRMRTMLLQRELRYLRLGPGCAMMFNNNRDIFFIDLDTYKDKLLEGMRKCEEGVALGENPWAKDTAVLKHLQRYDSVTPKCSNQHIGQNWGSVDRNQQNWGSVE